MLLDGRRNVALSKLCIAADRHAVLGTGEGRAPADTSRPGTWGRRPAARSDERSNRGANRCRHTARTWEAVFGTAAKTNLAPPVVHHIAVMLCRSVSRSTFRIE